MADDRRLVDADLVDGLAHEPHGLGERERVEHVRVAVAGHVDGDHAVRAPQPLGERRPVIERAREPVQQHDGVARSPLGHIDTEAVHSEGLRMHRTETTSRGDADEYRRRSYRNWQSAAAGWEREREAVQAALGPLTDWMLARLSPEPGQTLLELGAGTAEAGLARPRVAGRACDRERPVERHGRRGGRRAAELGLPNVEIG